MLWRLRGLMQASIMDIYSRTKNFKNIIIVMIKNAKNAPSREQVEIKGQREKGEISFPSDFSSKK